MAKAAAEGERWPAPGRQGRVRAAGRAVHLLEGPASGRAHLVLSMMVLRNISGRVRGGHCPAVARRWLDPHTAHLEIVLAEAALTVRISRPATRPTARPASRAGRRRRA